MAENRPPRMISRQLFGGGSRAQAQHPRNFGTAAFHQATLKPAGGGGLARGFGAGAGAGAAGGGLHGFGEGSESGDPVVNGNFQRMPHTYLYGFPIAGGGLSERGKEQQALNQRIQQYGDQVRASLDQGATFREAVHALTRSSPNAWNDLSAHPTALLGMEHLAQVLTGSPNTFSPVTKEGQQIEYDQNGRAVGAQEVPGFRTAPGTNVGEGTGQTFSQTYTKPDGTQGTREMQYVRGPNGLLQAAPVEGSEGEAKTAGKQAPLAQADIAGLPPQVTADVPKTAFNRQNYNKLAATPEVMQALQRMQTAAAGMGPVKGPVSALSGEYFGLNGNGAQFKADQDLLRTQAPAMMSANYKAALDAFMAGIGTASNAPSFIKLQAGQLINTLRKEGQSVADEETTSHQGKLPPALANQLIGQGIVPNGYQNQKTFDGMPPGEAALWKSRFAPQALGDMDKSQLFLDAAHGKFGSPKDAANTDPDLKAIRGIHQDYLTRKAAQQQQQTASTTATAAQTPRQLLANPAQPAPGVVGQPGEGTEPGAQQPQQGATQPQQGGQQQTQQPPGQQQPNGQQGQNEQPGQGTPPLGAALAPGAQLMPPTAVPGQPAQGVPATNGTTPQPPTSPLPLQTSQILTPQGGMPTPATQAPLTSTTPQAQLSTAAQEQQQLQQEFPASTASGL